DFPGTHPALVVGDFPIVVRGEDRQVGPVARGQTAPVGQVQGGGPPKGDTGQDLGIGQFFKGPQNTGLCQQVPHGGGAWIVVTCNGQGPSGVQYLSGRGKTAAKAQGSPGQGGGDG